MRAPVVRCGGLPHTEARTGSAQYEFARRPAVSYGAISRLTGLSDST